VVAVGHTSPKVAGVAQRETVPVLVSLISEHRMLK
jgi:hypothetical protein